MGGGNCVYKKRAVWQRENGLNLYTSLVGLVGVSMYAWDSTKAAKRAGDGGREWRVQKTGALAAGIRPKSVHESGGLGWGVHPSLLLI